MSEPVVEQEKKYNILKNAAGDLMILIRARMNDAQNPRMVYNGGKHALLYRNEGNVILLDFIHPSIRQELNNASQILIVEAYDGSIVREYTSDIRHLKELPIPEDIILN